MPVTPRSTLIMAGRGDSHTIHCRLFLIIPISWALLRLWLHSGLIIKANTPLFAHVTAAVGGGPSPPPSPATASLALGTCPSGEWGDHLSQSLSQRPAPHPPHKYTNKNHSVTNKGISSPSNNPSCLSPSLSLPQSPLTSLLSLLPSSLPRHPPLPSPVKLFTNTSFPLPARPSLARPRRPQMQISR